MDACPQAKAQEAVGRVGIVGAGVIGASIAYHLSLRGISCILFEREGIACASSGKAGGFLAKVSRRQRHGEDCNSVSERGTFCCHQTCSSAS